MTKFFSTEVPNQSYRNTDAKSQVEALTSLLNPEKADSTINANKNDEDNTHTAVIHNVPNVNDHTLDEEHEGSSEQQINIKKLYFSNIFVAGK